MSRQRIWVLKTIPTEERSNKLIDHYEDILEEQYNYDNLVPNHKQIQANDLAILVNRNYILGISSIREIEIIDGIKKIQRCPECNSSTIEKRKNIKPSFRCNNKHTFDLPFIEEKLVKKYSAKLTNYQSLQNNNTDIKILKGHYTKNYNANLSIQELNSSVLKILNINSGDFKMIEDKGEIYLENETYQLQNEVGHFTYSTIKQRRGQPKFRELLLKKYKNRCAISSSKLVEVLEAAHIDPYSTSNDHSISNGLLLRSDIHTLYDFNMLAIDPNNGNVQISEKLKDSEYSYLQNMKVDIKNLSNDALTKRWNLFIEQNK